jgi:2'-5' RNA ligase
MRLFVAIEVPTETKAAVAALVEQLRPTCPAARWVRAEGMHLTLKFIGEVAEEKRPAVEAALADAPAGERMDLRYSGLGWFPDDRRPRVLWAGIEAPASLAALAAQVETRLAALGIARESRPFHPHLTLARFDSPHGLAQLHALVARLRASPAALEFGGAAALEFHLYRSQLLRGGAVHTRLATFSLEERGT